MFAMSGHPDSHSGSPADTVAASAAQSVNIMSPAAQSVDSAKNDIQQSAQDQAASAGSIQPPQTIAPVASGDQADSAKAMALADGHAAKPDQGNMTVAPSSAAADSTFSHH